jgi:Spy/CpxP family protein refolding chaperone
MNRKISLLLTTALSISLATFPVYAKDAPPHPRPGDKTSQHRPRMNMEEHFAKELNLTKSQQSKINPILKKQGEQMRAIYKNSKLTPEQKHQQSQKLFASLPGKINKYLNKTQQAKLKQMVERHKNFKGHGRDGDKGRGKDGGKGGWGHKPGGKK